MRSLHTASRTEVRTTASARCSRRAHGNPLRGERERKSCARTARETPPVPRRSPEGHPPHLPSAAGPLRIRGVPAGGRRCYDGPMQTRELGKSGLRVSAVGLGCMGMSEFYGPGDESESVATIHRAIDLRCTFLDTADMYGPHRNE